MIGSLFMGIISDEKILRSGCVWNAGSFINKSLNEVASDIMSLIKCWQRKGDHFTSSAMKKPSLKSVQTGYPEFGVRKEVICAFFSPPMPPSTFHDRVNDGIIVPIKSMRGFYKLNDSLRRLGLREVPEIPQKVVSRTTEDIIRMAFHAIDPGVFPPPVWLFDVEAIDGCDVDHATLLMERYTNAVEALDSVGEKHSFMQGVLDIDYITGNS